MLSLSEAEKTVIKPKIYPENKNGQSDRDGDLNSARYSETNICMACGICLLLDNHPYILYSLHFTAEICELALYIYIFVP
jgi:hypothetical protein